MKCVTKTLVSHKTRWIKILIDARKVLEFLLINRSHHFYVDRSKNRFFSCKFCIKVQGIFLVFLLQANKNPLNESINNHRSRQQLTIFGLNGGLTRLCSSATQSISLKKECARMAASPPCATTQPKRLLGFLVIKPFRILTASLLNQTGYRTSSCNMDSNRSSSLSASNGGWPAIISYIRTPSAHQSTLAPYSNSW